MAEYSIGDVERIIGVRSHVLRYWEDAIPFIRPRKDNQGRRFYGEADLALLRRVKYLVEEEKYTIAGAGERLLAERTEPARMEPRDAIEAIASIRAELSGIHGIILDRRNNSGK
jgi:DNA-binding transcriptional MerR regulator